MNVRRNPNSLWVVQQLRDAWAYQKPHRFLLFDRDAKFGADVVAAVRQMGSQPTRTAFRSPWQNGVAERWVGSCRRDLLDHVIILNERHSNIAVTKPCYIKTASPDAVAAMRSSPSPWRHRGNREGFENCSPFCSPLGQTEDQSVKR